MGLLPAAHASQFFLAVMTVETSARVEITVTGLNDSSSSSVEIQSVFTVQRRERWETWVYVMPHSRSNHYVSMLCAQYRFKIITSICNPRPLLVPGN